MLSRGISLGAGQKSLLGHLSGDAQRPVVREVGVAVRVEAVRRGPKGDWRRVLRDLAANGVKVVSTDPQVALARLYGATRRHRGPQDGDLKEAEDDKDDGEEIAA